MQDLIRLNKILSKIQTTNSKTEKEDIIKANLDFPLFVETMQFLLDKMIVTGLSYKRLKGKQTFKELSSITYKFNMSSLNELMGYLLEHNSGRDQDIMAVQSCAHRLSERYNSKDSPAYDIRDLILKIASKSLKLGCSASTWNKVVPEKLKIWKFDVMLAKVFKDHMKKVVGKTFTITKKLDGNRIVIIKEKGKVKCYTRTGKPYFGLVDIISELEASKVDNVVFDGELLSASESVGNVFELFTDTASKAGKARTEGEEHTGLDFHIFDMLPVKEFRAGKSSMNAVNRKMTISNLFLNNNFKHCKEVQILYFGDEISKIDHWFKVAAEFGWEGIMINLDSPYVCKRTDQLLKVKISYTADLKISGFESGKVGGKNEKTLGNLLVDYKGYNVGVGTGYSDEMREEFWNNQDKYLGTIVEIEHKGESVNSKNDDLSLRHASFKRLRPDKIEPSYD